MKIIALYSVTFMMFFKPLFPVMEYLLNYEYIARVLCENKDKPELECNGQCYLMKSMAEEAGKQLPQEREPKLGFEIQLVFFKDLERSQVEKVFADAKRQHIFNTPGDYTYLFIPQLLKPPIS